MIINSKLSDEALLKSIYRAASEYSNLIENSYLTWIIHDNSFNNGKSRIVTTFYLNIAFHPTSE